MSPSRKNSRKWRNFQQEKLSAVSSSLQANLAEENSKLTSGVEELRLELQLTRDLLKQENYLTVLLREEKDLNEASLQVLQVDFTSEKRRLEAELERLRNDSAMQLEHQKQFYEKALYQSRALLLKAADEQCDLSKRHTEEKLYQQELFSIENDELKIRSAIAEKSSTEKDMEIKSLISQLSEAKAALVAKDLEISSLPVFAENENLTKQLALSEKLCIDLSSRVDEEIGRRNFHVAKLTESIECKEKVFALQAFDFRKKIELKDEELLLVKTTLDAKDLEISSLKIRISAVIAEGSAEVKARDEIFEKFSDDAKSEVAKLNCERLSERRRLLRELQSSETKNLEISSSLNTVQQQLSEAAEKSKVQELTSLRLQTEANEKINQLQTDFIRIEIDFREKLKAKEDGIAKLVAELSEVDRRVEKEGEKVWREIEKRARLERQHIAKENQWDRKFKLEQEKYERLIENLEIVKMQHCEFQQICLVRILSLVRSYELEKFEHRSVIKTKDLEISSLKEKADEAFEDMKEIEALARARVQTVEIERLNRIEQKAQMDLEISNLRAENKALKDKGSVAENSLRIEVEELRCELRVSRDESALLTRRLAGLHEAENTVIELTRQVTSLKEENKRQKRETESMSDEMRLAERETAEMIAAKEEAFRQLLDSAAESREEISRLKKELSTVESHWSREAKQDARLSKVEILKVEKNSRSTADNYEHLINDLKAENVKLLNELEKMTCNFQQTKDNLFDVRYQLQLAMDEIHVLQGDAKAVDHQVLSAVLTNEESKKALYRSNTLLAQSRRSPQLVFESSLNFQVDLPSDHAVLSEALRLTFAENEALREETRKLADDAATERRNFQVELSSVRLEKQKLERRVSAEKKLSEELEAQIDSLRTLR